MGFVSSSKLSEYTTKLMTKLRMIFATQNMVGAPKKAATVADMTNTDSIYVYTGSETGYTAGNWYYNEQGAWLSGGVYNAVAVVTDPTLSQAGEAADAAAVGAAIGATFSQSAKLQLLAILRGIGIWKDMPDANDMIDVLAEELFPATNIDSITAVYDQTETVYDSDDLNVLKTSGDLTVTANYSDGTSEEITDYNLIGTLTSPASSITVAYLGKTATISVVVTHVPTLDEVAYGNLTYRDLFITNNLLKYLGDFEDSSIALSSEYVRPATNVSYKIANGSPSISTEEANSGTHSLKASTTSGTSQNVIINNQNAPANSTILFAFSTKITRYVAGMTFLQYGSPFSASAIETLSVEHVTDGWEEVVSLHTIPSNELWLYVGSRSNPNLDGYVDDIVATPVPSAMTQAEAEELYSTYLEIRRRRG